MAYIFCVRVRVRVCWWWWWASSTISMSFVNPHHCWPDRAKLLWGAKRMYHICMKTYHSFSLSKLLRQKSFHHITWLRFNSFSSSKYQHLAYSSLHADMGDTARVGKTPIYTISTTLNDALKSHNRQCKQWLTQNVSFYVLTM